MKIIAYCNECMQPFSEWPEGYWGMYKYMVEKWIDLGQTTSFADTIFTHASRDFMQTLEAAGFILTTENGLWRIEAEPLGITGILYEGKEDLDFYKVCLHFDAHDNFSEIAVEENAIED